MLRSLRAILVALVLAIVAVVASAQPMVEIGGYSLQEISAAVSGQTTGIAQLAFDPASDAHLFAARISGEVTRYDYDAVTGTLSNPLDVATVGGQPQGLAFHGGDLYVSFYVGGGCGGTGDGRIARFRNPDVLGVYQFRHDFVHSIPIGLHEVNQLQVIGDSLFVGIGAFCNIGDPAEENLYTLTLARVADLTLVDSAVAIDPAFEGPVNYLADPIDWVQPNVLDGQLRYYASGFRNPFGLAIGPGGLPWLSSNGNGQPGFVSQDTVYAALLPGDQGAFPPPSFGFGPPHITGTPVAPLLEVGVGPSPTGFDFVPLGVDAGQVVMARYGAGMNPALGRDLILIDPALPSFEVLATGFLGPTDVVADPFGRLLVADIADASVWRLDVPVTACSDGLDNDLDGETDYPADLGCEAPDDLLETAPVFPCDDGLDNDGDGLTDSGEDPGCRDPSWRREDPACQDGVNNDPQEDGLIDFDGGLSAGLPAEQLTAPDPQCSVPWRTSELRTGAGFHCGLGFELGVLLPALMALGRRGRRGKRSSRGWGRPRRRLRGDRRRVGPRWPVGAPD